MTTESPDGGDVTALIDVAGQPLFLWKSGDLGIETEVDALRRKVRTWQWDTSAATRVLRERFVYGEALLDTGTYDPKDDHLRGRLVRVYDTAGFVELSYDFKGNVLSTTRRFFDDDEEDVDWQPFDPVAYPYAGDDKDTVAELHDGDGGSNPGAASLLETEAFTVADTFDALNRPVTRTAPDGAVTTYGYDNGGRLLDVDVDSDTLVEDIQYNARGQRTSIEYGNGVSTAYSYETNTFRLATLVTTRSSDSTDLQDLTYTYDPVGNIVSIADAVQDTVYFNNSVVDADQDFTYDALYRLTNAQGREKSARGRADWTEPAYGPVPDTSETMQRYEQRFTYDDGGNITEMRHLLGGTTDWVRTYSYPTTSNRLSTTTESAGTASYQHDARGNIVFWPHLYNDGASPDPSPNVVPDFRDQMKKALLNANDYAVYFYDHAGQRARKVVKKGANVEERRYVAGWEVWRKTVSGTLDEERTTLHVMDDQRRIAMIETKTVSGGSAVGSPVARVRYQLDNHLGTAILELSDTAGIISYEEYHPYGTCAWWAGDSSIDVSRRRYRYTGMERDDETGLQYHSARYYAAWLGRWGSADPIGLGDGANLYAYVKGYPVGSSDPAGLNTNRGRFSKHSERAVTGAIGELQQSSLFRSLYDSDTMAVESMSLGQFYREEGRKTRDLTREFVSEGMPRREARQEALSYALLSSRYVDDNSRTLRRATFREFAEVAPLAKAFDQSVPKLVRLYGKGDVALVHEVAHEFAHLFDPVAESESPIAVPFESNRAELFAEVLAQVILCQASGSETCVLAELSYAGEIVDLTPEATAALAALYEASSESTEPADATATPEDLVSEINRIVETLVVKPAPGSEY